MERTDRELTERTERERESPEARQAREYDAWEMSDEGIAAQDEEIDRWTEKNRPSWDKGADRETSR
jgi:aminoglycoside phosphotransferase (APT) family kinase protein